MMLLYCTHVLWFEEMLRVIVGGDVYVGMLSRYCLDELWMCDQLPQ